MTKSEAISQLVKVHEFLGMQREQRDALVNEILENGKECRYYFVCRDTDRIFIDTANRHREGCTCFYWGSCGMIYVNKY